MYHAEQGGNGTEGDDELVVGKRSAGVRSPADGRQVIEGTGFIMPSARNLKAVYMAMQQEIRLLCGSI